MSLSSDTHARTLAPPVDAARWSPEVAAAPKEAPFGMAPFIVIWEVTRACALACIHCRAEAIPHRHPSTTSERVCPSGFLPLAAGNVRTDDLVRIYREHPLFRALRDPDGLGGRCGRCDFRSRCGGSRARAYAATGEPLAEDPGCAYVPVQAAA